MLLPLSMLMSFVMSKNVEHSPTSSPGLFPFFKGKPWDEVEHSWEKTPRELMDRFTNFTHL